MPDSVTLVRMYSPSSVSESSYCCCSICFDFARRNSPRTRRGSFGLQWLGLATYTLLMQQLRGKSAKKTYCSTPTFLSPSRRTPVTCALRYCLRGAPCPLGCSGRTREAAGSGWTDGARDPVSAAAPFVVVACLAAVAGAAAAGGRLEALGAGDCERRVMEG